MVVVEWSLNAFLSGLDQFGWYDIALPFILAWVIVFAVLQKANIFGENSRQYNMILAIVAAFLFIRSPTLIGITNRLLPNVSILLLVVVLFLAIVGLFGAGSNWGGFPMILVFIVAGISIWWAVASSTAGFWVPIWARISPATRGPAIVTILIVAVGVWIYSSAGGSGPDRVRNTFNNMLGDMGVNR